MRIPRSFLFFIPVVLLFLLQLVPGLRLILLFLLVPVWSIFFINAAFIGLLIEARLRQIHMLWVLLTVVWFGGYYGWMLHEHIILNKVAKTVAAKNVGQKLSFDSSKQSLVFANGYDAIRFIRQYDVEEVYEFNQSGGENQYSAIRVVDSVVCSKFQRDKIAIAAGVRTIDLAPSHRDRSSGNVNGAACAIRIYERPTKKQIIASLSRVEDQLGNIPIIRTKALVQAQDGDRLILSGANAATLEKFPMPFAGCTPTDKYMEEWKCWIGFARDENKPLIKGYGDDDILSKSLGLQGITANKRKRYDQHQIVKWIDNTIESSTDAELQILDGILSDPSAKAGSDPFQILPYRKDLIEERKEKIIAVIDQLATSTVNGKLNKSMLESLLQRYDSATKELTETLSETNHH
ncbi:hypothetical protein [Parasphingorhabdus cellanae]|uniref:Uncharacterized protein n=1 Tax=Parasphingorhabdus cellanae TaxID=2806553 RepID=A0ABX7T0L2_9SPHN|nr:hypothetical protein [Parasphingorhabdus cellanae]QTD54498.1 hypothetical protein J4G78_09340 [Parasphingorhabdus cellanae]